MKHKAFAGLFAPYLAHDTDQERARVTLTFILRTLASGAALIAVITFFAGFRMAFILSSVGAVIMAFLTLLMRRGFPRATGLLLILTWYAIAIAALVTGDGIHDVAIIIFPAALLTASLLLNRTLFAAMAALSVVAVALVGAAEVLGAVETPFSVPDRWGDVAIVSIILGCVALLIRFLTEALQLSLDEARRNEQNFRGVFDATREAIIIHDGETGEILDANDAFFTMTGLDRDRAVGTPAERIYQGAVTWDEIRAADSTSPLSLEWGETGAEREPRRIEITFRRLTFGGRECVLAVARDITERRRLEDRLRQSEKMQAVGQLAGGIAHDFNNQLVGIVGYADILRAKLGDRPELAQYPENILRSARRASDLTAHLLAFARKGKVLSVTVDLNEIVTEVVELLERSIDKKITIVLDLGADPATTAGDPSQLQNCFLNLALNARDAMPDGGELTFTSRIVHLDDEACRSSPFDLDPGDYVEVGVADTGVGMSPPVMERIFEPFFTTKENEHSVGMGLAAVYGTVKSHKGAIGVASEERGGSTFTVRLPLLVAPREIAAAGESVATATDDHSGWHILLVDDEESVCETTAEMLRALGHRVTVCRNGREAVDLYRRSADDIDLVVLDMVMPVMGGGATFDELAAIDPGVPVLLASGYSLEGDAQEILDRGARGFVQKPFSKDELSRAVREALTADGSSPRPPRTAR